MRIKRSERGQATTEFVLVLPFFLLLFFLMLDFGWLLKNWIVMTNAAREATRCAVSQPCKLEGEDVTPAELVDARLTSGLASNITDTDTIVMYVDQNGDNKIRTGDSVVVCIQANNQYIGPVLALFALATGGALPDPMPLGAREEMRLEYNPPGNPSPVEDSACDFG